MKHWLRVHGLSFTATIKSLRDAPFTALLNMVVIALALSLPLGLYLVLSTTKLLMNNMPIEPQLTVFMHTDASSDEKKNVEVWLKNSADIKRVRFIPKEQGLVELAAHSGLSDILGGLAENPLPDAFVVTLKEESSQRGSQLASLLQEESGVETVLMDKAWAERLGALFAIGDRLLRVLVVVLGFGVILVTGNSIRMQILTRLKEIEVSKLIGATDAFIRRPFLYFAVIQGLMGALLAVGMIELVFSFINPPIIELANLYNMHFALMGPSVEVMLSVGLGSILLCGVGAAFSVHRHIRRFN